MDFLMELPNPCEDLTFVHLPSRFVMRLCVKRYFVGYQVLNIFF